MELQQAEENSQITIQQKRLKDDDYVSLLTSMSPITAHPQTIHSKQLIALTTIKMACFTFSVVTKQIGKPLQDRLSKLDLLESSQPMERIMQKELLPTNRSNRFPIFIFGQ